MVSTVEDREQLVGRVLDAAWGLRRSLAKRGGPPLLDLTLTMQQTKVLMVLSVHEEAMPGQALTRHLGVTLATLTGIVDRLVAQDLVTRREDATDRRVRLIALTEKGRGIVETVRDSGVAHLRRLLDRLDGETLDAMDHVLRRLREAADAEAAEQDDGDQVGACC